MTAAEGPDGFTVEAVVQIAAHLAREHKEYDEALTELVARINAAFPLPAEDDEST